jgi:hypothetical protein
LNRDSGGERDGSAKPLYVTTLLIKQLAIVYILQQFKLRYVLFIYVYGTGQMLYGFIQSIIES